MMTIPKDPVILLSYVNTQLRDKFPTFEEFCHCSGTDKEELVEKLQNIGYTYNTEKNQFV